MRTVGIITTFRQTNWGSVLQAYALQHIVETMGFDVKVIDYIYPNEYHFSHGKKRKTPNNIHCRLGKIRRSIAVRLHLRKPDKMYLINVFIKKYIKVTKEYKTYRAIHKHPPVFDVYMSGSDQIWNPNTMFGDLTYMFDFVKDCKLKISYASSFSCVKIPEKYSLEYQRYLSLYNSISVREYNGQNVISQILGKEVPVVLDPTLLIQKEEWHKIAEESIDFDLPENYILCYMLAYTYSPEKSMMELLSKVQKEYNYPIISLVKLPVDFHGNEYRLDGAIGVPEFLRLIENASIVVSSSFHGSAFALNFGKPIIGLTEDNEDDRLKTIFKNIGLESNLIYTSNVEVDKVNLEYDVKLEQERLNRLREVSLAYLHNALS